MSRQVKILVPGGTHIVDLVGQRDELLRRIEDEFSSDILVRGNEITITGDNDDAERAATVFEELITLLKQGQTLSTESVVRAVEMVKASEGPKPSEVMGDTIVSIRGRPIRPKTAGQKRYVDAIRKNTLTFAIGPAGTGKTYLAVALAVKALREKEISRIILTRPAVEAGERLGFLPGDIAQKVDPYLKPLNDALYEMLEPGHFGRLAERGTIEVAPLAYMRGRAQPYFSRVLTPAGFVPIGALQIGDLVIGSDGRPTRVLGVYPQGQKEVFRLRSQDGASTMCCGEHLWTVRTPGDKRSARGYRVVETRQMVGRIRQAHQHRFELPLVDAVEFPRWPVPIDPYAMGLLLGDGCITATTTPTFATRDTELRDALEASVEGIELRRKSDVDYLLRSTTAKRGGLREANPVPATLRELELAGTMSATTFVPEVYLYNASDVRLAVLQGLLDTDGGPVVQSGRTSRVQYVTTSPRLRDDVIFLVRSLGGVAYARTRLAAGRPPGRAKGRDVRHVHDSYNIDIRLPSGIAPFRLARKRERYEQAGGGGRPMRFVHAIEQVGHEDCVCIRVEAEDSLYVTDDFLVTHNTLNDSFIILDEAQNTTPEQMKMFLTRLGMRSKAVVTGDVTQIDLPEGQSSGLVVVQNILREIRGLQFVYLEASDVVRHKIVQDIVEAYREYEETNPRPKR